MLTRPQRTIQWALCLSLNIGLVACGSDAGAPPAPKTGSFADSAEDTSQASSTTGDATAQEREVKPTKPTENTAGATSGPASGSLGSTIASSAAKVKIDPANLTATQINYFLTTPQGAATFQSAIANPLVAQASGIPSNLAAFATADAASIANLLEIPQVAALIDQVVMGMLAQNPALGNTIATVATSMPNAAPITGAAPTTTSATVTTQGNALGSTLIK